MCSKRRKPEGILASQAPEGHTMASEDIRRNIADADSIRRCLAAFLIGYILAESGVSITAFLL
ncbi:MAG TPA: hypothetical protein EYN67_13885 [Flavobacteriales bacterium]|nr:hypothetical protein [Flavobacteriales bacterium]